MFPLQWVIFLSLVVGAVYFLPQFLFWRDHGRPQVLLEENYDEIAYATWVSRAANEYSTSLDPYLTDRDEIKLSFSSIQFLPTKFFAKLAIWTSLPTPTVFFLSSFIFPLISALAFILIGWCCGITDKPGLALCATFCLLMLPPTLWLMQSRYVQSLLAGNDPGFRLYLPHSRRYQPQFTSVIHYSSIAISLAMLDHKHASYRPVLKLLFALTFGATFYCYFFSWTLLIGWIVLGGMLIALYNSERLADWICSGIVGLVLGVPYFYLVLKNFKEIGNSAAAVSTRSLPIDPAIWITLFVCLTITVVIFFDRSAINWLGVPLILNLAVIIGSLQNVITGIYIQPYHYLHYFGRPAMNLALLCLGAWGMHYWGQSIRLSESFRRVKWVGAALCLLAASIFQTARYREVASSGKKAVEFQPVMSIIRQQLPKEALVYCPDEEVRESLALYSGVNPFFSRYMWLYENSRNQKAIRERLTINQWLNGMNEQEFSNWLRTRPVDVFLQQLQHPAGENMMNAITTELESVFAKYSKTPPSLTLGKIKYALLPQSFMIAKSRLPHHFECKLLWVDQTYSLYELKNAR